MRTALTARLAVLAALTATGLTALFAQTLPPSPAADSGADLNLFTQACGVCHALDVVTTQNHSRDEWRDVVRRMVEQNGAELPEPDQEAIVTYLARTHGLPSSSTASQSQH